VRFFIIISGFLLLSSWEGYAQTSVLKKVAWTQGDSLMPASLPVIIGSILVPGYLENTDYQITHHPTKIIWISARRQDTIWVYYRTLTLDFNRTYRNKMPSNLERFSEEIPGYVPTIKGEPKYESALNTSGNLSRGIGFGNAQDVALNSNLNLRINGIIAGDVELLAAISDDNNPIQPEGNTQQLQDFDRVFIQMKKQQLGVTLGDFEMQRHSDDYFLNYYKKSRGIHVHQGWNRNDLTGGTSVDIAVARGRFSRNVFDGLEGNRGPYRLKGSNGEIFIIIIAGTERIFLDGKLLERGEQNDYIIDYNSGEIVFMPRVIVTRYSRIIAEFQYSDRNYARSVAQNRNTLSHKNTQVYLNLYREADSRNQPFQQSLEGYDSISGVSAIDVLKGSGDVTQAFIPRVSQSGFLLTDRIMYRRNANGVYEYIDRPGEDSAYYEVAFSYLGEGKGNYRQQQSGANGRVYAYVPPVNGVLQGDYEPVDVLIPPKSQSMTTLGMLHQFKNAGKLKIESALSIEDLNTFSSLDDDDNVGGAVKIIWEHERERDTSRAWNFKKLASIEHTGASFRFIERYRDVEFNRNWNRTLQNPETDGDVPLPAAETIGDIWLQGFYRDKAKISYRSGVFLRQEIFKGISQEANAHYHHPWFRSEGSAAWLISESGALGNQNIRSVAKISMVKFDWQPGVYVNSEQSSFRLSDSVLPYSFRYALKGVSLMKQKSESGLSMLLDANQRRDDQPAGNALQVFTNAANYSLNVGYHLKQGDFISITGTYRSLSFSVDSLKAENTLQARMEASFNLFKKAIGLNTFVQTGTGQEQRREFSYLQVQAGNGVYVWNDYDSNGVQSLNEFENASELDRNRADYIRIFTPVQGFIQSIQTQLNQTIRFEPGRWVGNKHWLNRFASICVFSMDRKMTSSPGVAAFNPFYDVVDSQLVSATGAFRGTLFFNRSSPIFGFDYNYISNQNKALMVNGFEWRVRSEHQARVRWNLDKRFSFLGEYKQGLREYQSDFFRNRSYLYQYIQTEPRIQYQYKGSFRTAIYYKLMAAYNSESFGGQNFESHELGTEFKWLRAEKGNLGATFSWVNTRFSGDAASSLGYDLLQGLQPGRNLKWNFNAERRVAEKVQLSIVYDGRRGLIGQPIHIGRVMARYIF
jgi:hypothetical protein